MTSEQRAAIADYIERVELEWRSGQATEHTYRPMLKRLVEVLLPRVLVINEPKHIECGAPDYLLRRGTDVLGFIEAKDLRGGEGRRCRGRIQSYNKYVNGVSFTLTTTTNRASTFTAVLV